MGHVGGVSRDQGTLFPERLDDLIERHSVVRVIDAFVEALDVGAQGFTHAVAPEFGRPAYDPRDLLKLYLYGYMNRLRSSRELAQACRRNIEVLWLLHRLRPCFKTIAAFRARHGEALRAVCRSFVAFAGQAGLLGRGVVAIDGSKFAADNAAGRHYSAAQLERERARVERRIEAYLEALDRADAAHDDDDERGDGGGDDGGGNAQAVARALAALEQRRDELRALGEEMAAAGESARALTDADSAKMRTGTGAWLIGYNVQLAVDAEHGLIIHHEVVNEANDQRQLAPMALAAQAALGGGALTVVADTGYAGAEAAQACQDSAITAIVPRRAPRSHWPGFARERFVYDAASDTYQCPAGARLSLRGEVGGQRRYTTTACRDCRLKRQCTAGAQRQVTRHRHEAALEAMDERARGDPRWMRLRRATAEHPFGTLKRGQQARQFLTRGLAGVRGEMALSVIAYNLKRLVGVLGIAALLEALAAMPRGRLLAA